ncbi:N-acetylmuramic acid 6-phosphate etherase [Sutcliffiella rhizosphaerae]|uniref:N-acetylmuramic acid 6-phosphate etherase n=2 Tax=Sutcliffiella rhizosphaerae TaxID=2880967 RepID=A0ABN8A4K0_9BACI|nr:N-acetylmuramic acid 6-phosphate etherase [Sutcliffiella rhizosphaerae]CAG9620010.1 N-acetylmuramic acid 6-phosphate etherase [Sutcliffiella rhizosphaerae]
MNDVNATHLTEMKNQYSENLHDFSTLEIIKVMNQEDKKVAFVVENALPQIGAAIDAISDTLECGGRLFYIGAGTSGRLGVLDASECPPTFGVPGTLVNGLIAGGEQAIRFPIENAEDDDEAGAEEVSTKLTSNDILVGIASSGRTPYVLGAIKKAKELGIPTIGISCNVGSELCRISDYPIELPVGPEVVTGSTRLKAGTAQKMVLNMITTAVMIKQGKIYRNLMVNVQATNEKLRQRSISIIQDITGADEETAKEMNLKANGDTRVAILMILYGVDEKYAVQIINENNGHFPRSVQALDKSK